LVSVTRPGYLLGTFGSRRAVAAAGIYNTVDAQAPTTPLEIADGERRADVDVKLWKYAVISGRVVDERGDPLVGVNVRAARISYFAGRRTTTVPTATGADILAGRAITDDRGMFRFTNLMPAEYLIVVPNAITSRPAGFGFGARLGTHTYL